MSWRWMMAVATAVLVGVGLWVGLRAHGRQSVPSPGDALDRQPSLLPVGAAVDDPGRRQVQAPARVASLVPSAPLDDLPEGAKDIDPFPERMMRMIGKTQPVDRQGPGLESVKEALKDGRHPERLSVAIAPKAFDPQSFAADPAAYLGVVEPGRVFQVLQPGPEVPRLQALCAQDLGMTQGVPVELSVQAVPLAPVSFTSFDLAHFNENGLTAITVRADAQGVARVSLIGGPGCVGKVSVLAGSPLCSGQVGFRGMVEYPQQWMAAASQGAK